MFNNRLRKKTLKNLNKSVEKYDKSVKTVQLKAEELFNVRRESGNQVIQPVEDYINQLSNSPKEFDKSFAEYKAEFKIFSDFVNTFNAESVNTDFQAGSTAAAGAVAGVGTAALMPATAMAIATTFGTASTGTAIASLSGAAATNAALAWLGGGTLVAGGGGMAGGSAFLALAGPIGIGIGAIGIIGGGLFASSKNKKIAKKANKKRKEIEVANATLSASMIEINELIKLTKEHQYGVLNLLKELKRTAPNNYASFSTGMKQKLAALVNHINSLSALINKKID